MRLLRIRQRGAAARLLPITHQRIQPAGQEPLADVAHRVRADVAGGGDGSTDPLSIQRDQDLHSLERAGVGLAAVQGHEQVLAVCLREMDRPRSGHAGPPNHWGFDIACTPPQNQSRLATSMNSRIGGVRREVRLRGLGQRDRAYVEKVTSRGKHLACTRAKASRRSQYANSREQVEITPALSGWQRGIVTQP